MGLIDFLKNVGSGLFGGWQGRSRSHHEMLNKELPGKISQSQS
jgi:hypothetical protein